MAVPPFQWSGPQSAVGHRGDVRGEHAHHRGGAAIGGAGALAASAAVGHSHRLGSDERGVQLGRDRGRRGAGGAAVLSHAGLGHTAGALATERKTHKAGRPAPDAGPGRGDGGVVAARRRSAAAATSGRLAGRDRRHVFRAQQCAVAQVCAHPARGARSGDVRRRGDRGGRCGGPADRQRRRCAHACAGAGVADGRGVDGAGFSGGESGAAVWRRAAAVHLDGGGDDGGNRVRQRQRRAARRGASERAGAVGRLPDSAGDLAGRLACAKASRGRCGAGGQWRKPPLAVMLVVST